MINEFIPASRREQWGGPKDKLLFNKVESNRGIWLYPSNAVDVAANLFFRGHGTGRSQGFGGSIVRADHDVNFWDHWQIAPFCFCERTEPSNLELLPINKICRCSFM